MIDEDQIRLTTEVQQLINVEQAWHYRIIPREDDNKTLSLYISKDRLNDTTDDELEILFGKYVSLEPLDDQVISKLLGKYYRKGGTSRNTGFSSYIKNGTDDFLENLIVEAKRTGSSDIHIEIYEERCRVRLRIDGKMLERYILNRDEYPAYINKIKIRANLDIAEKRLPQDGRIFFKENGEKFDIRVSVLPTLYGEKVVLRLLSKDATEVDINKLGFQKPQLDKYLEGIRKPHGIVLISGPTGSGKTTTLYATLKILNEVHSNILTIEDPIEYTLDGINQVQLKESIGLTFTAALRTFLRQDPDVIMLGEIRDGETARMAIRAALTGHLVLSTVHTNSAWGIVSRLIDMGVPSFLLASTLNLAVAQRLVRLLCPVCKKKPAKPYKNIDKTINSGKHRNIFEPVGCNECYYTGYKGRTAIYEVIPIDDRLAGEIRSEKAETTELLKQKGILRLRDSALELLCKGLTSLEEVAPILSSDNS